jgi:hypothetical protein
MTFNLLKKQPIYQSSAKVVDGNLILSLPDAQTPIVWRMELGSVKASAMEIRTEQNDPYFHLVLKTAKGETQKIAPYDTRDQAMRALIAISKALETAQPQNQDDGRSGVKKSKSSWLKWVLIIPLGLIGLFVILSFISFTTRNNALQTGNAPTLDQPAPQSDTQSGVPIPADEMLRGF